MAWDMRKYLTMYGNFVIYIITSLASLRQQYIHYIQRGCTNFWGALSLQIIPLNNNFFYKIVIVILLVSLNNLKHTLFSLSSTSRQTSTKPLHRLLLSSHHQNIAFRVSGATRFTLHTTDKPFFVFGGPLFLPHLSSIVEILHCMQGLVMV